MRNYPSQVFMKPLLMSGASRLRLGRPAIMQCFFYVYVLASESDGTKHYTGITRDLSTRLREHNRGHCPHTMKHKPWKIETAIAFISEAKARAFEKYLKTGSGREFARRHF
jgi:putative endonuclease